MNKVYTKLSTLTVLICSITMLNACNPANAEEAAKKVESIELLRTDKSWNGEALPDYP